MFSVYLSIEIHPIKAVVHPRYIHDPPHPIEWNMKQYKDRYEMFSEYMENSSLNLHQDMFRKNPKYPGFSKYKQPCVFRALYDTVKPYLNQLSKLKFKQTESTIELILYRYIFAFTLQK